MSEPWGALLIIGPLLLLGVILYAWNSNRKRTPDRDSAAGRDVGGAAEPTVGTVNAVRGSEDARPDLEAEIARADAGADAGDDAGDRR